MKSKIRLLSLSTLVLVALFAALYFALPSNELRISFPEPGIGTPSPMTAGESGHIDPPVLVATAGSDRITITWQHVAGAVTYEIWGRQGDVPWKQLDDGSLAGDATSFAHTGLNSGETYYYTGRAVPAAGIKSTWASQVEDTVTNVPTLTASSAIGRIELSWTAVTGADSYHLIMWTDGLEDWERIGDPLTGQTTSYTHSGLTDLSTYHYRVRAVIDGTEGPWSDSISDLSGRPAAPALTATAAIGQIELNWGGVTGVDSYRLIVWTDGQAAWERIGDPLTGTTTSYTHNGLTAGQTYYYRVSALNSGIEGYWSDSISDVPSAPAAPTLTATASSGQVALSWTAVTGADSYHLIVWTDAQNAWVRTGDPLTGNTASYTHSGLSSGQPYYYRVRVVVNGTEGAWSNTISAVPGMSYMPGLVAAAATEQVELNWNEVTGAGSYHLIMWTDGQTDWQRIGDPLTTGTTSYTHTGLTAGKIYYYRIRAVIDGTDGLWSEKAAATP